MHVIIEDHFLGEVANYNKVTGKSPFPDEVIKAFKKRLYQIRQAKNTADLRMIKSLHFEKLKGKKYEGKYSIRLNISYRLIFRIENNEISRLEIICIEEINNHYS
ncbi:type II toxin-antitoxin system RelE/ParE family toxin [Mucilaginibacter sp. cycad4]|uniref:type II toxin-antitoxin system RelE/ParE family toxin n=1 Tax=Mucilaginibacter sp. cycad4 TaxID=3342096 RepID=UPI002AAC113A|nr:type II toxin-antitoxin system RelE/ParE family toxin [Mucilaginibacter gossypii]WPU99467.1 type II toxin-antitoxin system RelE/ParE family toxin [Mucilaginibacter gossypii]